MPWIAAAIAVGSWLSSEQGRKADKDERDRMADLLSKLRDPNFDTSQIDYPTFQVLQKYVPQVSDYVQEKDPQFIERTAAAEEGKSAQLEALRRLQQAGSAEGDIAQDTAINQANREAAIANQGQQGAILENMHRRGVGGSGLELAAQLAAQQSAAERGGLQSEMAANEGYKNRLNALMQSGQLGGQLENTELSNAEKNAAILNAFNQRNATNANAYNQYKSGVMNEAQQYNLGNAQRVYEKNTQGKYDAARSNQDMVNKLAQQKFQNDLSKITGQQNQSNINRQANEQNTVDRNNMIQGLGNAAQSYGQYQDQQQRYEDEKAERQKDRDAYGGRSSDIWSS